MKEWLMVYGTEIHFIQHLGCLIIINGNSLRAAQALCRCRIGTGGNLCGDDGNERSIGHMFGFPRYWNRSSRCRPGKVSEQDIGTFSRQRTQWSITCSTFRIINVRASGSDDEPGKELTERCHNPFFTISNFAHPIPSSAEPETSSAGIRIESGE
jgi:hypothetical protein